MEGWKLYLIEYIPRVGSPVASGSIWTPPRQRPADEEDVMDAVVDAIDSLEVAETRGDIIETVEELCRRLDMEPPGWVSGEDDFEEG